MSAIIITDQTFAAKTAMEIFRTCGLHYDYLGAECRIDGRIAKEVMKLNLIDLTRITAAYPDLPVYLSPVPQGSCRTWLESVAIQVVAQEIRRIVGATPRFGERHPGENWIFLGGDHRPANPRHLGHKRTLPEPSYCYVDLWGQNDTAVEARR